MNSSILTALEKKLFTGYSAVILALTTSGILWVYRLYRFGLEELLPG